MNMEQFKVLRAEQEWQRAGAYSVRIQGMNRQHGISLREEFDEHDCDGTRYIVILDNGYPIGTCRFYEKDAGCVILGRVVVLPEYRGKKIGAMMLKEAEAWMRECGYTAVEVDSRVVATGFYAKLGYEMIDGTVIQSGPFECIKMRKMLR